MSTSNLKSCLYGCSVTFHHTPFNTDIHMMVSDPEKVYIEKEIRVCVFTKLCNMYTVC